MLAKLYTFFNCSYSISKIKLLSAKKNTLIKSIVLMIIELYLSKKTMRATILTLLFIAASFTMQAQKRALIIIDVQEFYFDGPSVLVAPDTAAKKASILLDYFRKNNELVVHIKHKAATNDAISAWVKPLSGEKVITKEKVNSFVGTDLQEYLKSKGIQELVICGMMTHMCVEGTFRAATDLGYKCTLAEDACTTRDLTYDCTTIPAVEVHKSTLATLSFYGKISNVAAIISGK